MAFEGIGAPAGRGYGRRSRSRRRMPPTRRWRPRWSPARPAGCWAIATMGHRCRGRSGTTPGSRCSPQQSPPRARPRSRPPARANRDGSGPTGRARSPQAHRGPRCLAPDQPDAAHGAQSPDRGPPVPRVLVSPAHLRPSPCRSLIPCTSRHRARPASPSARRRPARRGGRVVRIDSARAPGACLVPGRRLSPAAATGQLRSD